MPAPAALGVPAEAALRGTDLFFVLHDQTTVRGLRLDFAALSALPVRGVAVTAPLDGTATIPDEMISRA